MTMQEIAQAFADKWNVRVFPMTVTADGSKAPVKGVGWKRSTSDAGRWTHEQWNSADGYGVVPDGYTVLDFDSVEAQKQFRAKVDTELPQTLIVKTPHGMHVWLRGETKHGTGPVPHMDVRSGGDGYIVGPGSTNPRNGKVWKIWADHTIADIPQAWRDVVMGGRERETKVIRDGGGSFQELANDSGRNESLIALKGAMIRWGFSEEEANDTLRSVNAHLEDPLSSAELNSTLLREKNWETGSLLARDIDLESVLSNFKTSAELERLAPPKYIIEKCFPEGTVNIMYGPPGSYKSFIALDWAARIADGIALPVFGGDDLEIPRERKTLYVAAEGLGGIPKRIKAAGFGKSSLMWLGDAVDMRSPETAERFANVLVNEGIELVFYDTLRKISPGADENSVKDMGQLISNLESIATKLSIPAVVVHHSNRTEGGGSYRGSSSIEADSYNMWNILVESEGSLEATIKSVKFKDAPPFSMIARLCLVEAADSLRVDSYMIGDGVDRTQPTAREMARETDARLAEERELFILESSESNGQLSEHWVEFAPDHLADVAHSKESIRLTRANAAKEKENEQVERLHRNQAEALPARRPQTPRSLYTKEQHNEDHQVPEHLQV